MHRPNNQKTLLKLNKVIIYKYLNSPSVISQLNTERTLIYCFISQYYSVVDEFDVHKPNYAFERLFARLQINQTTLNPVKE